MIYTRMLRPHASAPAPFLTAQQYPQLRDGWRTARKSRKRVENILRPHISTVETGPTRRSEPKALSQLSIL